MSDLYGFSQPVTVNQFRDRTASHSKMAGVTFSTFICKACGKPKHVPGSRWVDGKTRKGGRICADCVPAADEATAAPLETTAKVEAPAKPTKPAKALKMTDAEVLECREAHEFDGVRPEVLARKYEVDIKYMRQLLDYAVRSKLIPARHRNQRK